MIAPDKPLHERITAAAVQFSYLHGAGESTCIATAALLREAAEALRNASRDAVIRAAIDSHDQHEYYQAELSRMRTALEEIRAMRRPFDALAHDINMGAQVAYEECAAIAERALTAGSGNE